MKGRDATKKLGREKGKSTAGKPQLSRERDAATTLREVLRGLAKRQCQAQLHGRKVRETGCTERVAHKARGSIRIMTEHDPSVPKRRWEGGSCEHVRAT